MKLIPLILSALLVGGCNFKRAYVPGVVDWTHSAFLNDADIQDVTGRRTVTHPDGTVEVFDFKLGASGSSPNAAAIEGAARGAAAGVAGALTPGVGR